MFEQKIKIKSYDVDHNDNLRVSSLLKYFQQIARENLDEFGMTYSFLRQYNIVFVLTKYAIKLHSHIHSDQTVILKTSPCAVHGVSFVRDFVLESDDGKKLAEASSAWVIIDYEKRSILRPNRLPMQVPVMERLVNFLPERTNVLEEFAFTFNSKVTYSKLDANNHLNNCNYVDIVMDGLYANLQSGVPDFSAVNMQFEHEAKLGDELCVNYVCEGNKYFVKCQNITSDNICFSAELEF